MDVASLAELLHETAEHHGAFEASTPPHDWWDWYAPYLAARLDGSPSDEATRAADGYMEHVCGVVRVAVPAPAGSGDVPRSPFDELHTILVAVDGSRSSVDAVAFAIGLAAVHHAALVIVHVVRTIDLLAEDDEDVVAVPHEPTDHDQALLTDAAAVAAEHGVDATTAIRLGSTAEEIVAYADACAVDLIVVGSRGHRGLASALLGSVSLGVVRRSTRPVLVVQGGEQPHAYT